MAAAQVDLALGLVLSLFSPEGLDGLRDAAREQPKHSRQVAHFLEHFDAYRATIGPVIRFLQGRDPMLAHRINARALLPEGALRGLIADELAQVAKASSEDVRRRLEDRKSVV